MRYGGLRLYVWVVVIGLIDQLSKFLIVRNMELGESIPVLPFLHVTFVSNTGTAFGLFQGVNIVFILISFGIIAGLLYWRKLLLADGPWAAAGFVMVLGGAFGNLIDRIFRERVIDFLDLLVWPVFNVADMSICCGTLLLAIFSLREKRSCAGRLPPVKDS